MVQEKLSTIIEDEHQIVNLFVRFGYARDSEDWDTLSGCFHDDATTHISWVSGSAKDWVEEHRTRAALVRPFKNLKHVISRPWVKVKGNRGFGRCYVNLYVRFELKGHDLDLQSWFRLYNLVEKRDHVWRIYRSTAVYEKDRLDPVDPRGVPQSFFDDMDLAAFPDTAKYMCYWLTCHGHSISSDILSVYSDEERALREECEVWLERPG